MYLELSPVVLELEIFKHLLGESVRVIDKRACLPSVGSYPGLGVYFGRLRC